ncbi:MAG: PilC/PilY family type IV pilus protein [Moraxella sp.]|nr:PilC/PilY family type IV pilus protein [Moraxella sp.]
MKKPKLSLKSLCLAISSLMAMMSLSINTHASDIEIYKSAEEGNITIMLLLDISGSMNLSNSMHDDYLIRSGNRPEGANGHTSLPTPNLDKLAKHLKDTGSKLGFADQSNTVNHAGNHNSGKRYTRASFNELTDADFASAGVDKATALKELTDYLSFAPYSWCQDQDTVNYAKTNGLTINRPAGWETTLITETAKGGYQRQYCRIPTDISKVNKEFWKDNNLANNKIIPNDVLGCEKYDSSTGKVSNTGDEYRCYSRIARLKDALYDIINGNPEKGVAPLGDNISLGIATLGVRTRYNGTPWSKEHPLDSDMDIRNRDLGAIRVPARRLDSSYEGKSQRQILNEFIGNNEIFEAHTGTPTARSYAETVSYMMGTSTLPPADKLKLQERDLFNGVTYAHRVCIEWNNVHDPAQCIRFEFADITGITEYTKNALHRVSYRGTNGDQSFIYGKPVANYERILNGTMDYTNATNGSISATYPLMMNVGNGAHLMFGYPREYITGFPFSAPESKTPDGLKYQQPSSLTNQNPQCSGQGIYVLSDGAPSMLPYEEGQMQRALGEKGANFKCSVGEILGQNTNNNDWECMWDLAETIKDPAKNPANLSFKTAAVGFGREFINGSIPAYDPEKTVQENLNGINGTTTIHNFARWGVRGEGGWYAGTSSQSVVDSINAFVANLVKEVPEVATGQPFVPIDPLNPLTYMDNTYYGSIYPKVTASYNFWAGDMNKYRIAKGRIVDKSGKEVFNEKGSLNTGIEGEWDSGMTSKLVLRDRPLFTNTSNANNINLDSVNRTNLFGTGTLSNSIYRNAWLNMLGYKVAVNGTPIASVSEIANTPELRQVGALLHSTPIILTQYGSSKERQDYLLYGSTQGAVHIVNTKTGVEKLAFVPYEMVTNPKSRNNFQSADNAIGNMSYGVDGQWTAYTQYIPDGHGGFTVNGASGATSTALGGKGVQWAYGGLRMGGRSYYALDLSDIDNPKLKFHIDPDSAGVGSPLSYMGQSWSKPTLGFVSWYNTTTKVKERRLVMFVGGGYDDGYENRLYSQTNGVGGGVYMFDAHDGELLWWASSHAITGKSSTGLQATNNPHLKYSVPSNISTFDRNNDGLIDHLLFGDLGGQVFRVDLDNFYDHEAGDSLATRVVRVYNGHQAGGLSPRFYEAPSLSVHSGAGASGQFGVISIASGNRSSPLAQGSESARDALFVIYDHDVLRSGMTKKSMTNLNVADAETDNLVILTAVDIASGDENKEVKAINNTQGWKYYLSPTAGQRKGYSTPRVVSNFLFLNTFDPAVATTAPNECSAGVIGQSYQEAFCMPGGVCVTKQQKEILSSKVDATNETVGSPYSNPIGIGIVQSAIGIDTDNTKSANQAKQVTPYKVDCESTQYKYSPVCLTEISSISNKPVRWYENNPRS